jgi:hypothetical protein
MRLPIIIAAIVCSFVFARPADAHSVKRKKNFSSKQTGLQIRVEGDGWGSATQGEIESVLYSVADELLTHVPQKLSKPIVVTHAADNPIALYEKGRNGEYLVHLSASGHRWAQFAYQFAHELCHIMSNYEENVGADTAKYNQWLEEALCETASLYTLRSMATTWEVSASTPERVRYAPSLRDYAQCLIDEGHRQLPPSTALAAWLRENEEQIRKDPYLREKNEVVANLLLPLFEQNPENWDTLRYLNLEPADARNSLKQYLHNWYANAPGEHKIFIANILAILGIADAMRTELADSNINPPSPQTAAPALANVHTGQAGRAPSQENR